MRVNRELFALSTHYMIFSLTSSQQEGGKYHATTTIQSLNIHIDLL